MEGLVDQATKSGGVKIQLLTPESLTKIAERIESEKKSQDTLTVQEQVRKNLKREEQQKQKPNPALIPGKKFPEKLGSFPKELYGKPIEDIDEFYKNQYTFMVVAKDNTMFRFSATKAFFILSPFVKIRSSAIYALTHPFTSLLIMLVILVNCVFMALNTEIADLELFFTVIYTIESLSRMVACGFILTPFTYLRDPWNWLDFVVVLLAYVQIVLGEGSNIGPLRTFRVFRALKTVTVVPGLKIIIGALMVAVKRLRDVTILTLFMLSIFALVGLQLYHGKLLRKCVRIPNQAWLEYAPQHEIHKWRNNADHWLKHYSGDYEVCDPDGDGKICPTGYECLEIGTNPNYNFTSFDNFFYAFLCAFRLMTQDYWESLYQLTLKCMGTTHMFFFIFVVFLGSFYLVNLILAIVAMSYDDCRKKEEAEAEEELASALELEEKKIALIEEAIKKSPSICSFAGSNLLGDNNEDEDDVDENDNLNDASQTEDTARQLYNILNYKSHRFGGSLLQRSPKKQASIRRIHGPMTSSPRNSMQFKEWSHENGRKSLVPEVWVEDVDDDNDAGSSCSIKTYSDNKSKQDHTPSGSRLHYPAVVRRLSKVSNVSQLKMDDVRKLQVMLETSTHGRLSFKAETPSRTDRIINRIYYLLFGWEYPEKWKRFAKGVEMFIMDPFVDLFTTLCIVVNTFLMAFDQADNSPHMIDVLLLGNYIFTIIFAIEAFLKIIALEFFNYLKTKWHCFDLLIVTLSLIEMTFSDVKSFSILRSFRLLRIFKLAKSWPTLNLLIGIIGKTMGALGNLCFVLAIIVFIFAVMGMQVFGKDYADKGEDMRWHFKDFLHSFMIVFRVLCGEWIESMWDCMRFSKVYACIPFFMLTMIIGNLVILNLFLALLLSSFTACQSSDDSTDAQQEVTKLQQAIERVIRFNNYMLYKSKRLLVKVKRIGCNLKINKRNKRVEITPCHSLKTQILQLNTAESSNLIFNDHLKSKSAIETEPTSPTSLSASSSSLSISSYSSFTHSSLISSRHNDLSMLYGPNIKEVTVVSVDFPADCCPRQCLCRHKVWSAMMDTSLGRRWWSFRCYCKILVQHKLFESFIIVIILLSSLTLALEDKYIRENPLLQQVLNNLDKIFTVAFTMELLLKLTAHGPIHYFNDAWCWLDFVIVVVSLVGEAAEGAGLSNMIAFRALRTLRALRPLKAVSRWEGMRVVVNALFQAIPAIFNVLLVCLVFWLIFSIMGVTLFAGKFDFCINDMNPEPFNISIISNKEECLHYNLTWYKPKVNFDNVFTAYLALFQVATFKGWIDLMRFATDMTEKGEQPSFENKPYMYLYFVAFIVFGSFFTLNLFIGVIIDNFNMQKRRAGGSLDMFLTEDQKRYYNAMKKLGSKQPQKPVPRPKLKCQLFFFKLVSNENFDIAIMFVIILNMISLAIEHHNQEPDLDEFLDYTNQFFVAIFTLECVLKLMAYRIYYFKYPWNIFDFSVVIISILGLALINFVRKHLVSPTLIRVIRVFRVGRVLRLVKSAKGIRTLLFSLAVSMPALFNIGLLLFLIMFIYAVFGMSFFMDVKYSSGIDDMFNFETVYRGLLILFQTATSAGWSGVLEALQIDEPYCDPNLKTSDAHEQSRGNCGRGGLAVAYLVTYLIISFLVIINMYIAVILENFSQATEDVQRGLTQDDIDMYYEAWERFDEDASGYIRLDQLSDFLDNLEPPLGIPVPNYFSIIHLDIPICDGDQVHCVDILDSLAKNYLGTSKDAARELGDVKKGSGKKNYATSSTTLQRQREIFCAKLIQIVWRKHVEKKKMERAMISEKVNDKRRGGVVISCDEDLSESTNEGENSEVFCDKTDDNTSTDDNSLSQKSQNDSKNDEKIEVKRKTSVSNEPTSSPASEKENKAKNPSLMIINPAYLSVIPEAE